MFTQLDDSNYKSTLPGIEGGIVLFFKKLCPHCKNIEKMLEKFSNIVTGLSFYSIDSEENPDAMQGCEVERVPTILVVKKGRIVARKTGLLNPREMAELYNNA